MSNSPLVSYTRISPNRTSPRNHKIDTITIHCYVGQVSVEQAGEEFAPVSKQASCNYCIGKDGRVALIVPEEDRSWCSSNTANDNRAITIECASETKHPYAINSKVYESLVKLCADICRRNGIKELKWRGDKSLIGQVNLQNMTVHRWFKNKACPGDYIYNRLGQIASEVNTILNGEEEIKMDVKEFKELWLEMRKDLKDNDSSSYSAEARDWAIKNKLIQGNGETIDGEPNYMWEDVIDRQQFITVLHRFAKLIGKA